MASRQQTQRSRERRQTINKLDDEFLSLNKNKNPRSSSGRTRTTVETSSTPTNPRSVTNRKKSDDSTISDAEMKSIEKQIVSKVKEKAKSTDELSKLPIFQETGKLSTSELKKIVNEADLKIKPKIKEKDGKPGFVFGKGAKFRPFGGVLARALLGEDEKFGGDRGAIDFIRPKKKNMGGMMMKKKGYKRGGAVQDTDPVGPKRRGPAQRTQRGGMGAAVKKGSKSVATAPRTRGPIKGAPTTRTRSPATGGGERMMVGTLGGGRGGLGTAGPRGEMRMDSIIRDRAAGIKPPSPASGPRAPRTPTNVRRGPSTNIPGRGQRAGMPPAPTMPRAPRAPGAAPTMPRAGGQPSGPTPPGSRGPMPGGPSSPRNPIQAMKKGGMAKKGYAKGGAARKKARGVGAATRGFGKAMR